MYFDCVRLSIHFQAVSSETLCPKTFCAIPHKTHKAQVATFGTDVPLP